MFVLTEAVSPESDLLVGGDEALLGQGRSHAPLAHARLEHPHTAHRALVEGLQLAVVLHLRCIVTALYDCIVLLYCTV